MNATIPMLVIGIDVAKDALEVASSSGEHWSCPNDPKGQRALRDRLLSRRCGLIVLEATGGYEAALVGTLAIAGLPPLNGFASEWMLFQAFLLTPSLPNTYLNMLVPVGTAALALAVALAGYVMVKFYGIVFLGLPREPRN